MADRVDIYKIAVSIILIHVCIIIFIEGASIGMNPDDTIINAGLNNIFSNTEVVGGQIEDLGICLEGTASESDCLSHGCIWDDGQCFSAVQKSTGVDFGFFDVILSILKIPLYLGKVIVFIASVVFYEMILSYKLMPLVSNTVLKWLIGIVLWTFQMVVLYYLWGFISNFRGVKD